jgi:hypothetical protein
MALRYDDVAGLTLAEAPAHTRTGDVWLHPEVWVLVRPIV